MTSTMTSVAPDWLKIEILPPVPILATTRLGVVCPARKLRFEVVGRVVPVGNTVRYDAAVGLVAVTLTTTASTPVAGTPPRPTTVRSNTLPGLKSPVPWNWPSTVGNAVVSAAAG